MSIRFVANQQQEVLSLGKQLCHPVFSQCFSRYPSMCSYEGKSSLSVPDWKIWKVAAQHHRAAPDPLEQVISEIHQSQPCPSFFPVLTGCVRSLFQMNPRQVVIFLHSEFTAITSELKKERRNKKTVWLASKRERYGEGLKLKWRRFTKIFIIGSLISAPYWPGL